MENVIAERVKHAALTKAQLKIADYFARYPEKVGISSSMEVAKEIGVSDASITRFARAIGYDGFTDLKNDIYNSLAMQATGGIGTLSLTERFDANRAQFASSSSKADYLRLLRFNLERTFQQNSDERFDHAVSMLLEAKHRYVVGFRGCLGVASQCAWLMRFLLEHVISISDEGPGGIGTLQDIGPEDCMLLFSLSRYYKSDLRLIRLARKRGAKICLITNSVLSPIADLADVMLLAETKHMSFFNSTAALNLISEYLITKLSQIRSDEYHEKASERDKWTEDLRL
ncbi:MurR/RpiR family transcriptional regulator [uncultured Dysosmobacter sp.]|uniref:MurR/RpiR family transcriptional regulator n=1 Tax=uncultured Dysosmobacter sp. TaxID=2591384 RepID=UPI0026097340|nr:MurR/RpiR family transcriptional regulator [uncultured Dysosmobacter sp.]